VLLIVWVGVVLGLRDGRFIILAGTNTTGRLSCDNGVYVGLTEPSGLNITNSGNDRVPDGIPLGKNPGAAIPGYIGYGSLFGESSSSDDDDDEDELGSEDTGPIGDANAGPAGPVGDAKEGPAG